jgi:hypothetical protein
VRLAAQRALELVAGLDAQIELSAPQMLRAPDRGGNMTANEPVRPDDDRLSQGLCTYSSGSRSISAQ